VLCLWLVRVHLPGTLPGQVAALVAQPSHFGLHHHRWQVKGAGERGGYHSATLVDQQAGNSIRAMACTCTCAALPAGSCAPMDCWTREAAAVASEMASSVRIMRRVILHAVNQQREEVQIG